MTTVLVVAPALPEAPELVGALSSAGLKVLARCECSEMVRQVVRRAPDVVVVWDPCPGVDPSSPLFTALQSLHDVQPTPVLVFTSEVSAEAMEVSLQVGVASWVVNGFSRERLRPLVQYTLARGRHSAGLREELRGLRQRYEERRLVDRAKGILMSARQVSEDEAFRLLRSASMQAKQRIGQRSQQVIDAALYADAINQSGRLRMLSQRIVKLYALGIAGVETASSRALLAASALQVQEILDHLNKTISRPSFGDLMDVALRAWSALAAGLGASATRERLPLLDEHAEELLVAADTLTSALEGAGLTTTLHVINVSGRQRMYSQRLAKQALLSAETPEIAATVEAFDSGMTYLQSIPLSTPSIVVSLDQAQAAWRQLRRAVDVGSRGGAALEIASSSELLLDLFDQLTGDYERSMQVLIG